MTLRTRLLPAVAILSIVQAVPSLAVDSVQTRVSGVVRDASGGVVPSATVAATNQTTRTSQTTTTANDGSYSFELPPGSYTVVVTVQGFRRSTQTIDVRADTPRQVDFVLQASLSEEVTVTALKRESAMLDVPFSVAAPTEQVLRERGIEDIEGIAANVAGFTVQNLGPGQSQVAIRGISAGQIVRDQPGVKEQVASYLDESVISLSLFTPDIDLFDVSRVEVLRGPQGTLFGSGSLAGTVRYITNQPEMGVTRTFAELGGSLVGEGGAGGNVKAGFNAPLGDQAALRVAGYYVRLPGYIDAVQPNLSVEDNVNDGSRTGVRATARIAPDDRLAITPRVFYQSVRSNGWNRVDVFNILANPFTTTRPPVSLGERGQFTQFEEEFTDDFLLADLNLSYRFGDLALTSITSYGYRDVLVVRDATALTASITGGSLGLPENIYSIDAPLNDATTAHTWSQEARLAGGSPDRFPWVAGVFFSRQNRDYGQDLPVAGFETLSGIPTQGLRAPRDVLFFSDLSYDLNQFALFGEATFAVTEALSVTAGLRFYRFSEQKEQVFDGIFANDDTGSALVSQPGETDANGLAPRIIASYRLAERTNLNAQISRGFRLGGINDPLNEPLCTPQDLITFGGRETWDDETVWNYEVGLKSRILNGRGGVNLAAFYADIHDLQATVTAGSCSSRVVFNVPNASSKGVEIEFDVAPVQNFDFAVSAGFTDAELGSTLTSTDPSGNVTIVSGIEEGRRLPTVPRVQVAAAATYQRPVRADSIAYVTGTYQHIGSRYTQVGDDELGTLNMLSFGANTLGGPLTTGTFFYDAKLPAYDIVNLRVGLRRAAWDVSLYLNNLTDERALLSLDRERGTLARISYLTNQPRTFGIATRLNF